MFKQINLKKSPLELLVQTCSSIESSLYHSTHPVLNKCTMPYSPANQNFQSCLQKINKTESCTIVNKNPSVAKNDIKVEKEQNILKRFSVAENSESTPSPKKKKITTSTSQINETNSLLNSEENYFKFCQKLQNPKREYRFTPQILTNNLHQSLLKTHEVNDQSRKHACNWMVGSSVCGRSFFTSEDLLLHLQSHAAESSIQQMHSFYSNQLYSLQSFYNTLQQQNMAQIAQVAGQKTFGSLPVNNYPDIFAQNNLYTHLSRYSKLYNLPTKPF